MPSFRVTYNISYFCSYGDLTPRAKLARLFAIIWIIVGIISSSLLCGKLSTALTVTKVKDNTLYGQEVCLLN